MSRIAVVGSCITRDLWPIVGETPPEDLLYISRTSLPSLMASPLPGLDLSRERPEALGPFSHRAMVEDLRKTALSRLLAHRPTHVIFDFIDERVDLLAVGGTLVTHSWELEASGQMSDPAFGEAHTVARNSPGCELLWRRALAEFAALIAATPLAGARLILHEAQWATQFVDETDALHDFPAEVELFGDRRGSIAAHNALLRRYEGAFRQAFPAARTVNAGPALRIADKRHRWGLSPFHYVPDYYREVLSQLHALGV
ncbi:MAG TPA: DUF6270 domain-containing protein [Phenylobacterium sp.]|uniref:DUF6270 domain-containing protein n=1 Tax=Phenylobacterium sp. TaxID=1871053 RepID=UPI002F91D500